MPEHEHAGTAIGDLDREAIAAERIPQKVGEVRVVIYTQHPDPSGGGVDPAMVASSSR
jgi:hypothetical protein